MPSEELIDNNMNDVLGKRRTGDQNTDIEDATRVCVSGTGNHLTPTKQPCNEKVSPTNELMQGVLVSQEVQI